MTIVLGYERLTLTLASAAWRITLRAIALVSTFARGTPIGTAARRTILETSPGGTPSTLTDLVTSTGLSSTSHAPPATRARTTARAAANIQGRRRTRAARASNRAREDGSPEDRPVDAPGERGALRRREGGLNPVPAPPRPPSHPIDRPADAGSRDRSW